MFWIGLPKYFSAIHIHIFIVVVVIIVVIIIIVVIVVVVIVNQDCLDNHQHRVEEGEEQSQEAQSRKLSLFS